MLSTWILLAGFGQLSVLIAAAQVPFHLNWKTQFNVLPRLHRQMYWTYGGYVGLAIVAFAMLSLINAHDLANGSTLSRSICGYMAIFWAIRLCLQAVFDVKPHLKTWWLKLGYHTLSLLFVGFTCVYGYAALHPA